jgi:hypothetical protein
MAHKGNARQQLTIPAEMTNSNEDRVASNRGASRESLRALLFAGGISKPGVPMDTSYFDVLRDRIKANSNTAKTMKHAEPRGQTAKPA